MRVLYVSQLFHDQEGAGVSFTRRKGGVMNFFYIYIRRRFEGLSFGRGRVDVRARFLRAVSIIRFSLYTSL